jgi:hypothetical protein
VAHGGGSPETSPALPGIELGGSDCKAGGLKTKSGRRRTQPWARGDGYSGGEDAAAAVAGSSTPASGDECYSSVCARQKGG